MSSDIKKVSAFKIIRNCLCVFALLGSVFATPAFAKISSVGYIHNIIRAYKNIDVPIEPDTLPKEIATARYLMRQIDRANEILNGMPTSDYLNSDMAERTPITSEKARRDIEEYIREGGSFYLTLESADEFGFYMTASGNFIVDWGDGNTEIINRTHTDRIKYSHIYSTTGNYTVKLSGRATGYTTIGYYAAIAFVESESLVGIDGSLGAIFPTLGERSPSFYETFAFSTNLTGEIPPNLFRGVTKTVSGMFYSTFMYTAFNGQIPPELFADLKGAPTPEIFSYTFFEAGKLTGPIPENLFAGISGAPVSEMFSETFHNCTGLTSIPAGLFNKISGENTSGGFNSTFKGCTGLTGAIPSGLFGKITGNASNSIFSSTFEGCTGLETIEDGIWDVSEINTSGLNNTFAKTFNGCSGLKSESPNIAPGNPLKLWEYFRGYSYSETFRGATGLSDYDQIPASWK